MKFKKTKETRKKVSKNIDLVTTTYTEDPNGELKVKFMPPIVIKLDDESSKNKK